MFDAISSQHEDRNVDHDEYGQQQDDTLPPIPVTELEG
jgi:hypothetical protein